MYYCIINASLLTVVDVFFYLQKREKLNFSHRLRTPYTIE